jgi:CRISPR/Cas system CSM-associated protein Csm3 (group 7 of RAMP superfamily)
MGRIKLTFTILSYWHAGSGSGEGANMDAVVVKTPSGLPYLPGKTVKGLLREAVQTAEDCGQYEEAAYDGFRDLLKKLAGKQQVSITTYLFGTIPQTSNRYETEEGSLTFSSATLGFEMESWALEEENLNKLPGLYAQIASTSLDDKGQADDNSLRRIEVSVPLSLSAELTGPDEDDFWIRALQTAAPLMRGLGSHRNRGLGRVKVEVTE